MAKAKLTFADINVTVTVPAGTRIIEVSEQVGAGINYGCRESECGNCLVRILSGAENLSIPSAIERNVLKQVAANPDCRLACQTLVLGDVTLTPA